MPATCSPPKCLAVLFVVLASNCVFLARAASVAHGSGATAPVTTSTGPDSTVELVFQAIERRLCYDEFPEPSLVQYGFACGAPQHGYGPGPQAGVGFKPLEAGFCDFTTFVTTYREGSTVSDTVQTFGNFWATCFFPSPDDSCSHPFTSATALSIQGTVNGLYGALISALPPRPKSDDICVRNDAKPRVGQPGNATDAQGPGAVPDPTRTAQPAPASTQGADSYEGPDRQYRGVNPGHQYSGYESGDDIGAYRIPRLLLFRGHVRVQSPGPVSNLGLGDGYFEFPLYAVNLDYSLPPDMLPVSKAEAAGERVFHPFQATMSFKRQGLQEY